MVLGDSRGAQRILTALDATGDDADTADRAGALYWQRGSKHRPIVSSSLANTSPRPAIWPTRSATSICRRVCCYYLAYVVSHHGQFREAIELTDRSRALYADLDRPWDQVASWLFTARAAISAGDEQRSVEAADQVDRWLQRVDDPWQHVRRDAMLGELARIQHRFDDAVAHIGRAAEASRRLGFLQTEAYQVSSLGRALCQAGDYETGCATLQSAVDKAEATGDVRMAALARVHLGRVLRALGNEARACAVLEAASAWHNAAGGGEQAALGDCLLAAMDLAAGAPGARQRLESILAAAKFQGDAHVEVFVLDALARAASPDGDRDTSRDLFEQADQRMEAASHFITDRDRTDAHAVRRINAT